MPPDFCVPFICIPCIISYVRVMINKVINQVLVQVNNDLGNVDSVSNMLVNEDGNILTLVSKKPQE